MIILGLSAFYHDSAAAIVVDGEIVAAAQEERFTRKKHDSGFPHHAVRFCLERAGVSMDGVDRVVFYDKPFLKFERLLETYIAFAPRGFGSFRRAMPIWIKEKLFQRSLLEKQLALHGSGKNIENKVHFAEHHLSHAASCYFPSPFEEALILTIDGVGEWATTSVAIGKGNSIEMLKEMHFPHSLGLLYSAFTYYTGFKVNSGEYKLMGLAPYGRPTHVKKIFDHLIDLKEDGTFHLDLSYFNYCVGLTMTNKKFDDLFGGHFRKPEQLLIQEHMDLAASIQAVTEEIILRLTRSLAKETGLKNLCLAGGVALNCVANGKILKDGKFDSIWVQPAAGDSGGALGAALIGYYASGPSEIIRRPNTGRDGMKGSYLGPEYSQAEIEQTLTASGAVYDTISEDELLQRVAQGLADGDAVGWFQGRMEFGPRALGARSILGDARSPKMQSTLNLKVKYRESFRPFAPAVLREKVSDWFEMDEDSPYMLMVAPIQPARRRQMTAEEESLFGIDKLNVARSEIPAVTHVDYSARVQTVHRETNPLFYGLIERFEKLTGCPVIVNTSFNVRGEPIVCKPEEALRCFMGTELDTLVIGRCLLRKRKQPVGMKKNYEQDFELD
jgi:carbamoyltransferase